MDLMKIIAKRLHSADHPQAKESSLSLKASTLRAEKGGGIMRKIFVFGLFVLIIGCAHRSEIVLKDTDYLKYGQRASVIQKVWGGPDETMAYQDFKASGYFHSSHLGGSWDQRGGTVSGGGFGTTYTPTTIVWIYKDRNKALFFQQRGLLDEPYKFTAATIMVWKLVGWQNLRSEKTSSDDDRMRTELNYVEKKIKEAGITSESDIKLFWAVAEKVPKNLSFEDQVDWTIMRTKEIISQSGNK